MHASVTLSNWFYPMVKKRTVVLAIILAVMLSLHFSSFEVNTTPVIGSTTVTLYSVADAYVNASSPETNYGSADSMYVSASSEQDFAYLKFDLTSIPSGANILSATLKVYLWGTGGSIYGSPADKIGAYYCPDNSWTESGITWNNKPSFNPTPSDTYAFGMIYYVKVFKSWIVSEDVKAAFPSGIITEVLKFESKTGNGYALFSSREDANRPKLEVEYSTQPVFAVNLESSQDTGITHNLGLITFANLVFSLPTAIDVVAGSYQIEYGGGYQFMRWETSGGITVSDVDAASTTVTVSGDGNLSAVGNVEPLEYTYDCKHAGLESQTAGYVDAVRFTPLFSGQLVTARFYIYDISSLSASTFKVHVMDQNRYDIITPFSQTPDSEGWFDVDLWSHSVSASAGADFYIGMEWITDNNPDLGEDTTSNFERSWIWNGTNWEQYTYGDFMIRAVVGTLPPSRVLSVSSAHGSPNPSVGSHSYSYGASVTCDVSSPVVEGGATWTCTGWTGTGSVPLSGSGTSTAFTITQYSSITWIWQGKVAAPVFSPVGGTYTGAQSVSISCSTSGANIRYTTNGAEPTSSSTLYTGSISVTTGTTTIKAKAFASGMTDSDTASATYTIQTPTPTPTPTPTSSPVPTATPTPPPTPTPTPSPSPTLSPSPSPSPSPDATSSPSPQPAALPVELSYAIVAGVVVAVVIVATILALRKRRHGRTAQPHAPPLPPPPPGAIILRQIAR
jgi:hypothetical protein